MKAALERLFETATAVVSLLMRLQMIVTGLHWNARIYKLFCELSFALLKAWPATPSRSTCSSAIRPGIQADSERIHGLGVEADDVILAADSKYKRLACVLV